MLNKSAEKSPPVCSIDLINDGMMSSPNFKGKTIPGCFIFIHFALESCFDTAKDSSMSSIGSRSIITKLSPSNYIIKNPKKSCKKLEFENDRVLKDCTDLLNRAQAKMDEMFTFNNAKISKNGKHFPCPTFSKSRHEQPTEPIPLQPRSEPNQPSHRRE
jgi:hypothetical protein